MFAENYPKVFEMNKSAFTRTYFNQTFNFAGRNFTTGELGGIIDDMTVLRLHPDIKQMQVIALHQSEI